MDWIDYLFKKYRLWFWVVPSHETSHMTRGHVVQVFAAMFFLMKIASAVSEVVTMHPKPKGNSRIGYMVTADQNLDTLKNRGPAIFKGKRPMVQRRCQNKVELKSTIFSSKRVSRFVLSLFVARLPTSWNMTGIP